jgi:hypothetical protein
VCLTSGPSVRVPDKGLSFAKEPRPRVYRGGCRAGSREPSWCGRYEGLQTHGRAKGSSRNVGHEPTTHALLKASGALTEWTPRAGAGCTRSLAHLAAM